jgi:hypothetical protein
MFKNKGVKPIEKQAMVDPPRFQIFQSIVDENMAITRGKVIEE